MFKSVLIAEDHESASISVQKTLKDLEITSIRYAYYCDDALLQLKNSIRDGQPYELLVTDLSFEEDGHYQTIGTGGALIEAAKKMQPGLKVLVFSAERKEAVIADLFSRLGIDGFVRKARRDAQSLKEAIESIYKNKKYYPVELRSAIRQKNAHDFTAYDIMIISQLAGGALQKNIPVFLQKQGIKAFSLSSIEKRLNQVKEALNFTKNEQLVAYCKEKGVI